MNGTLNDWRSNLILTLRTIASEAEQGAYSAESGLPLAEVPGELVCMWGDDLYHPERSAMAERFSASELEAMADFNERFEAEVRRYREPEAWSRIMVAAGDLVARAGWDSTTRAD